MLGGGPGAAAAAASREPPGPCRVKTVTVSTLPVLRENDISWSGAPPPAAAAAADSRLLLFVRSELPGRVAVQDDLDNTELPFFTLEMSGTVADISLVHWKQQWLENGTLYFHVSMSSAEHLSRATPPSLQEPSEIVEEQMHILHISVMGGLIALLLLLLVFTVALYAQRRWHKRRRIPQKSASTEATHEIHYIPSVLLGPQARESFRNSRLQAHNSVIGVPIRETPILDDYEDEEEEETPRRAEPSTREDEFGSQVTRTLESLGRGGEEKPDYEKKAPEVTQETVESLMQKFKESFRTNTPIEIGQLQPALRSTSIGRRKRRSRPRGGIGFGRAKGNSGSEADDETQLTFYTEQYRSRRRSKGSMKSPVNKTALTLIAVSSCILAMVCGSQLSCPLTVKVTLHVPEHFIADGSSFVVSEGSYLDISDWLNPAKLSLYYQINATSPWVRDLCGQRTTDACEQLCDQETGECSCHEGYAPDPVHRHLCVRSDWGHSEGPWPYTTLERGYDLVTGEQAPEKILRSTYSLGQGLWLPVSKSFVVPPVELSINPLASCKTDVLVTEDPADVRPVCPFVGWQRMPERTSMSHHVCSARLLPWAFLRRLLWVCVAQLMFCRIPLPVEIPPSKQGQPGCDLSSILGALSQHPAEMLSSSTSEMGWLISPCYLWACKTPLQWLFFTSKFKPEMNLQVHYFEMNVLRGWGRRNCWANGASKNTN